ncbi:protein phosphatase 2C domain-containing protein [Hirsutella rhossiliensis]|uniref:Protein phosphatase 2C domain-containing protein n=1 Tax=Hirsutella rhossiliensis TaxID=111463 RepID=A0A9P8SNE7_9HYPO|nr:protein phosphatase 2C domain-containing protein [Hirsutella rhossiliensis]KAH0967101.1 protein phosphatase 2C domain-containing protein [Hirsutella rhossiliensis]
MQLLARSAKPRRSGSGSRLVGTPRTIIFSKDHFKAHALGRRSFHTYFVTHLPSSSLHPDSSTSWGPSHKMPRDASTPHTPGPPGSAPAVALPNMPGRDLTVVRIPLRRAKHHFGSCTSRGSRPYNEDADQAGIVNIPAFARRAPMSVKQKPGEATPADSASGDPQVFYFAVFDGHGGSQCSHFLRDELYGYIEEAASEFDLQSTLRKKKPGRDVHRSPSPPPSEIETETPARGSANMKESGESKDKANAPPHDGGAGSDKQPTSGAASPSTFPVPAEAHSHTRALQLQKDLVKAYGDAIGGYFRRFSPENFNDQDARKSDPDDSDMPLNHDEILGAPHATPSGHGIGGTTRFKGGSTASVALISTPTPAPFWHPGAQSTLLVAHVGDSRILLCETATGRAQPLTSDHHPTTPTESRRLRRYAPAGSMVTGDSFGEERIAGLANSRAFGDIRSKRIGVSAEPETTRVELGPAQYSFLVLMSDGVSGTLSDQEIVDVVKEARTPEQGARSVVEYATEVSADGDNATCQVVRLGGWERRSEGGLGSLGTKEIRDARRAEAQDPRRGKR